MELRWVIVYVQDPAASVAFWERAFGLQRRSVHESGTWAELETGSTLIGFASHGNAPADGVQPGDPAQRPAHFELALTTDDVQGAYDRAVAAGAAPWQPPAEKPWGQIVAYVRDPDGTLVEICTPVD
jgi:lactoylglutathione lyase